MPKKPQNDQKPQNLPKSQNALAPKRLGVRARCFDIEGTFLKFLDIEGGSVNRCFKTPVIIANTGYRKGLPRKLGCGKIAAPFLNIPTSRRDRPASPPDFSRKFSDLETPIYRAPLYKNIYKILPIEKAGKSKMPPGVNIVIIPH
jgi:hypothetical protein